MKLYPECVLCDREFQDGDIRPDLEALLVTSHGCKLYGHMMTPGGKPGEKHPLAIMMHGFPGNATNNDIAQALCRMGFVVMNPFYRGAWGSEGFYSFTGKVEDIVTVANWAVSEEIAEKYLIDTESVFLVGHSMGGYAAVNVMRKLSWIKGGIILAPYDMPWFFENGREEEFIALLPAGYCLKQESPDAFLENARACWKTTGFSQAFDDLKDRNLYFIGAARDDCAPPATMIEPLFNRLQAHKTNANQKYDLVDSDHCFSNMRIRLCGMIADWLKAFAD